ncbi:hypothetical protein [Altericroceibacterium xinjiangense]|uniref:hypothetical protein n=1 Tax=Altericroceibacterium xinjiangense TaxID=762261 RepID=UPI000F7D6ADA|nr:hypothetical protein [Altericroceibacterium xinjiangense]
MNEKSGPGISPARFLALALWFTAPVGWAFPALSQAPAQAAVAAPDEKTSLKLLWSTMAAIDQANKTGNYSVLRDLGTPDFQARNTAAGLAEVFAPIRTQRVDLSDTLLVAPQYDFAPAIVEGGLLRMRGSFPMRPTAVAFDLLYRWQNGWRLHAVAIRPTPMQ